MFDGCRVLLVIADAITTHDHHERAAPLDPTVRALGVASLLNDFSSEVDVRTLCRSDTPQGDIC